MLHNLQEADVDTKLADKTKGFVLLGLAVTLLETHFVYQVGGGRRVMMQVNSAEALLGRFH
jgi:hypothetical protein